MSEPETKLYVATCDRPGLTPHGCQCGPQFAAKQHPGEMSRPSAVARTNPRTVRDVPPLSRRKIGNVGPVTRTSEAAFCV